jgi:hypothetical protein
MHERSFLSAASRDEEQPAGLRTMEELTPLPHHAAQEGMGGRSDANQDLLDERHGTPIVDGLRVPAHDAARRSSRGPRTAPARMRSTRDRAHPASCKRTGGSV